MNNTLIGTIARSNSHIDYVCQTYRAGEVAAPPAPTDYAFGTFVRIESASVQTDWLVGVVYTTLLMNPDFGNLGPRLSPAADLQIFSPDYLSETMTLVGIQAVGMLMANGESRQGVPSISAQVGAQVERLTQDEVRVFHTLNSNLQLAYMPMLLSQASPLVPQLLLNILDQVQALFPNKAQQLEIIRSNLAWKTMIQPAG